MVFTVMVAVFVVLLFVCLDCLLFDCLAVGALVGARAPVACGLPSQVRVRVRVRVPYGSWKGTSAELKHKKIRGENRQLLLFVAERADDCTSTVRGERHEERTRVCIRRRPHHDCTHSVITVINLNRTSN
jgi:hypothetical protein